MERQVWSDIGLELFVKAAAWQIFSDKVENRFFPTSEAFDDDLTANFPNYATYLTEKPIGVLGKMNILKTDIFPIIGQDQLYELFREKDYVLRLQYDAELRSAVRNALLRHYMADKLGFVMP
jgi:hypothetical protein